MCDVDEHNKCIDAVDVWLSAEWRRVSRIIITYIHSCHVSRHPFSHISHMIHSFQLLTAPSSRKTNLWFGIHWRKMNGIALSSLASYRTPEREKGLLNRLVEHMYLVSGAIDRNLFTIIQPFSFVARSIWNPNSLYATNAFCVFFSSTAEGGSDMSSWAIKTTQIFVLVKTNRALIELVGSVKLKCVEKYIEFP